MSSRVALCRPYLFGPFCGFVRRLGRKEILMFFYLYAIIELLAIFLDSGIIPTANVSYPVSASNLAHTNPSLILGWSYYQWFAAIYTGLVAGAYTCLLINGFVGFQFAEDGTPLSLWVSNNFCTPHHTG